MQNLLLLGFTEQNANVIEMFIEINFPALKVAALPRTTYQGRWQLPVLTNAQRQSELLIIDVEGVGLDGDQPQAITDKLSDWLDAQPALLITRQKAVATLANTLDQPVSAEQRFLWLTVPYNRQQMAEAIQQLINYQGQTATTPPTAKSAASKTPAAITPAVLGSDKPIDTHPVQRTDTQTLQTLFEIVANTFGAIEQTAFFNFAKRLQLLEDYTYIEINNHHLYVNPFDNSVVASRLERVIDQFMVSQTLSAELFNITTLDEQRFKEQTQMRLKEGDKHFMLSQVIWFMGLELIQRNQYDMPHNLSIEAKYMPNLSGTNFVPSYVVPMIASCLGRPRRLLELNLLFPALTSAQSNQVIMLMIMSNIINAQTLIQSYQRPAINADTPMLPTAQAAQTEQVQASDTALTISTATSDNTHNAGVQKASETGFLKRLLGRLGVKLS